MAEYFDVLTSIINKKEVSNDDVSNHFVGFMAIKWLSINPMACYVSNQLNSARGNKYIPKEAEYRFLKESIKLPKNTKLSFDKNDKDTKVIIDNLMSIYKTGRNTILEYMDILGGEKIISLLEKNAQLNNKYTTDPKIIELRSALVKKKNDLLNIKGIS
ncbi:MAG: hypothetical protein ACYDD5_00035 [Sulfuricurvum sp.]